MAKLIKCKACDAEISASAKTCPSCGHKNKKPIFKQWWFYVVIVVVVLIIAIGSSGGSDAPVSNPQPSNATETPTKEDTPTEKLEEKTASNENNQTSQEATTPNAESEEFTPVEVYERIGENPDISYTLSPKAEAFLKEHPELFPHTGDVDALNEYADFELETRHVSKNPSNYGDKMMHLGYVAVKQIFEEEITPSFFLTELNLVDEYGDQYYVFYIGQLDDVFEYDELEVYGLPLNTSGFDNTDGGTTLVVVLAGSYIEKLN